MISHQQQVELALTHSIIPYYQAALEGLAKGDRRFLADLLERVAWSVGFQSRGREGQPCGIEPLLELATEAIRTESVEQALLVLTHFGEWIDERYPQCVAAANAPRRMESVDPAALLAAEKLFAD